MALAVAAFGLVRVALILALLLAGLSRTAEAEQPPRLGVLMSLRSSGNAAQLRENLQRLGYVEGKNLLIDWKMASERYDEVQGLAGDLVRTKADVILAVGDAASRAVLNATSTIPVVFVASDPVLAGFAKSLSHPGTNGTGIYIPATELATKQLELLMQLVPRASRIAYFRNPSHPFAQLQLEEVQRAATTLGVKLLIVDARNGQEIEPAIKRISKATADGVLVSTDAIFPAKAAEITSAVRQAKIPAVYPWRSYHQYGALMSYGPDTRDVVPRIALYVDRILKGAKPTDLPIEATSRFELIIDLREARALGLEIPQELLLLATEIIR
jgi:putative ABC transport system substrate-binding protein